MFDLLLLTLATFWAWVTVRYILESFIPDWFYLSRTLHPFLVLALPLYLLWPDWLSAMAVAGAVGVLVVLLDLLAVPSTPQPVQVPRRSMGGLPPLP